MARLCLNMIVKNESARIERALQSVLPYVSAYVIADTGSTDDTIARIQGIFAKASVPGLIVNTTFENWSQARNVALSAGRTNAPAWDCNYLLLMDADMELVMVNPTAFKHLDGPSYDMTQVVGSLEYLNRRLVRVDSTGMYVGVTHEYLDVEAAGAIQRDAAYFNDKADGANRPNKAKRDIKLLRDGLKKEPGNSRYFFYLAQSYKDDGNLHRAIQWYQRRVEAGGWPEEQWYAQLCLAICKLEQKKEDEFVLEMLKAYCMRPTRAESLFYLAHFYRNKGSNALAAMYAETAMQIPPTTDALFVDKFQTTTGPEEEFAISGFYTEWKRAAAAKVNDRLSITAGPFEQTRSTARANQYFYVKPLKDYCPSFEWNTLVAPFLSPDYVAMNPSIALHKNKLMAVVRYVNYRMDDEGRYLIRGTDGTANATNPINTRNVLVSLDDTLKVISHTEINNPPDMSCAWPLVTGYEDMRLFSHGNKLWTSATVRQFHADGNCEQVLSELKFSDDIVTLGEPIRMLREPRQTEKNWMPVQGDRPEIIFAWRVNEFVNSDGKTELQYDTKLSTDRLSGSSQVIQFYRRYLAIVHEAQTLPGSHKRYYYHRFVRFNLALEAIAVSPPFYFNQKLIEFCAGLCWHPNEKKLVISYGEEDKEPRLATITPEDVERLPWRSL
jgi:glycosyltransferase involved in cell wall biosynthesis